MQAAQRLKADGAGERSATSYRPEIDGLRALAVAAVILYHIDAALLPGGLAGVDVFFVISGYLITGRIMADVDRGNFSFARFWLRRLRRIVPALLAVLTASSIAAVLVLPPDQFAQFGKALIAAVLPVSNFYLRYQPGGYFALDSRENPLIHMWSLAVEEQFYLLYPAALLAILRFRPRAFPFVFALGLVLSLTLAAVLMHYKPEVAFYYLPPRAWELMLGGAVTMRERRGGSPVPTGPLARPAIWLSLAGLLAAFLIPGESDWFPWPGALLPCFSAAALIALLRPADGAARLLSSPPMVFVGLISYSLYLWHQPAFAFARAISVNALSPAHYLAITAAVVAVSWASWRFIEQPLRRRDQLTDRQAGAGIAIVAAALIAAGLIIWRTDGWPDRFSARTRALMTMSVETRLRRERCQSDEEANPRCTDTAHWPPKIVILGDSHGYALSEGLTPLAAQGGTGVLTLWRAGCPPILGRTFGKREAECTHFMDVASRRIAGLASVHKVILMARWARHLELHAFDNGEGGVEPSFNYGLPALDDRQAAEFGEGLVAMVERLRKAGKQVVIVGPVPEVGWSVPEYMWKTELLGHPASPTTSYARFRARQARALKMLGDVSAKSGAPVIYPDKLFCSASTGRCLTADGPMPLYHDDDHLSPAGARILSRHFASLLLQ
ncbi:acyltransferase family protein [Novosphingobium sp.]|uniref:acyltransferase family protein n=1 Tax=Novosphingobium sp. TaxID=1874826 RepID=UPI003BABE090